MAAPVTDSLETQKEAIKNLLLSALVEGATWYVVDRKWFERWKSYVSYDIATGRHVTNPGPIDNSNILQDGSTILKPHLAESVDYILVPEEAWQKLVKWYSLAEDQEAVARRVIKQGLMHLCKVEVNLIDLKLSHYNDPEHPVVRYFSCTATLSRVVQEMRHAFNVAEASQVRLLSQYLHSMYEPLNNLDATLEEAGIGFGSTLVLEEKNANGSWPRQQGTRLSELSGTKGATYGSYSNSSYREGSNFPGLCGLSNLGNTCFMNSALQCMSNVPPLTEYMLTGRWKDELNTKNPLGMRGEIATTYASLIHAMWSGKNSCAVPRNFKVAVGRFKPEFSGYQQQDSQELMAFLLDGLHEDLNRIHNKPYVEIKEAENRPDEEVAQEAWRDYQLRNDSIIVDIFHGLLKSTLVCPECSKVSIKFDPFCYLSLPLPAKKERQMVVFFIPLKPLMRIRQLKVIVPKAGCIQDLCEAVSAIVKVPELLVTDIYNHRFHKIFSISDGLAHISERDDIYVFEVPTSTADEDEDVVVVPVYMREVT